MIDKKVFMIYWILAGVITILSISATVIAHDAGLNYRKQLDFQSFKVTEACEAQLDVLRQGK